MFPFSIAKICELTGGVFFGDAALLSIHPEELTIDTRKLSAGDLYVCIRGESFDGHAFAAEAAAKGALCVLADCEVGAPYIRVADTVAAFQAIAHAYRKLFSLPVIAVTGSAGKTSTKEMLCAVLSQRYNTLKSLGNLNNQTGAPQVLLTLQTAHKAAIVEMGMNHFGEIDALARMTEPDFAVITNIGDAHIGNLGSREGIFRAKTELLAHLRTGGRVVVCGDDAFLRTIPNAVLYGMEPHNDVRAENVQALGLQGTKFDALFGGRRLHVHVPVPGMHMVINALCGVALGWLLSLDDAEIAAGIYSYIAPAGRMEILRGARFTILNDAYNASPASMRASIDVLAQSNGRKVFVMGDMLELGEDAPRYHAEVGAYAREKGIDLLLCVGELSRAANGDAWYPSIATLCADLPAQLRHGDAVLIKASHGSRLDGVAAFILKEYCPSA
ncbi:MAG: UDP-N-acetylmuramoyl-tripeptide--D-alanyl-D-alanine ligase [Clostridiales bacterium]|nr:UDP-N-acetylmuramoyl-tripeptide--D-alanyl-D-alanine ligase [Clostridiales bacterium]